LIAKVFDLRTVTAQIAVMKRHCRRARKQKVASARAYPDEIFYGTVNFVSTSVQAPCQTPVLPGRPRCFRSFFQFIEQREENHTHHHAN